jgi:hypothetical protein
MIIDERKQLLKKYSGYTMDYLKKLLKTTEKGSLKENVITYIVLKRQNKLVEYYSRESQQQLKKERELKLSLTKIHFGYKHEAYYTEDEMINGFQCCYEDLSESEKAMYNFKK